MDNEPVVEICAEVVHDSDGEQQIYAKLRPGTRHCVSWGARAFHGCGSLDNVCTKRAFGADLEYFEINTAHIQFVFGSCDCVRKVWDLIRLLAAEQTRMSVPDEGYETTVIDARHSEFWSFKYVCTSTRVSCARCSPHPSSESPSFSRE